jgi:hypothetical protein
MAPLDLRGVVVVAVEIVTEEADKVVMRRVV